MSVATAADPLLDAFLPISEAVSEFRADCAAFERDMDSLFGDLDGLRLEIEREAGRLGPRQSDVVLHRRELEEFRLDIGGEFQRLRELVESQSIRESKPAITLAGHRAVSRAEEPADVASRADRPPAVDLAASAGDPVLDSVKAQFDRLQRNIARKPKGKNSS